MWIRGATRAIRGADGRILSYFGYHEDIIEDYQRREGEYLLRRIRELIGAMVKEGDIQPVLVAVRQALQQRGLTFNACGINVIDDTTDPPTVHSRRCRRMA